MHNGKRNRNIDFGSSFMLLFVYATQRASMLWCVSQTENYRYEIESTITGLWVHFVRYINHYDRWKFIIKLLISIGAIWRRCAQQRKKSGPYKTDLCALSLLFLFPLRYIMVINYTFIPLFWRLFNTIDRLHCPFLQWQNSFWEFFLSNQNFRSTHNVNQACLVLLEFSS